MNKNEKSDSVGTSGEPMVLDRPNFWQYLLAIISVFFDIYVVNLVLDDFVIIGFLFFIFLWVFVLGIIMGRSTGYLISYYIQKMTKNMNLSSGATIIIILVADVVFQLVFSIVSILGTMIYEDMVGYSGPGLQTMDFAEAFLISSITIAILNVLTYVESITNYTKLNKK